MLTIGAIKNCWKDLFKNFKTIGIVIFFLPLVLISLFFAIYAIIEFFVIDVCLILVELCSKDCDLKFLFRWFLY